MNILEAIKALREGKACYRPNKNKDEDQEIYFAVKAPSGKHYLCSVDQESFDDDDLDCVQIGGVSFSLTDNEATDWAIYEKKKPAVTAIKPKTVTAAKK